MDRLQRIYKLHQILSSACYPVSRQLLEEKLECSTSSIKRIIEELRLYFNAPIKYDREHNGYFYDASEGAAVELPGLWFNANELYALLTVQQLLEQSQPGLLSDHLRPIKSRLEKILATAQLNKDEIAKRIRILQMTARKPANVHFQAIASALLQRKQLRIQTITAAATIKPPSGQFHPNARPIIETIGIWTPFATNVTHCAALQWIASVCLNHSMKLRWISQMMISTRTLPPATAFLPENPRQFLYCFSLPSEPAGWLTNSGIPSNKASDWQMAAMNCVFPMPMRANSRWTFSNMVQAWKLLNRLNCDKKLSIGYVWRWKNIARRLSENSDRSEGEAG